MAYWRVQRNSKRVGQTRRNIIGLRGNVGDGVNVLDDIGSGERLLGVHGGSRQDGCSDGEKLAVHVGQKVCFRRGEKMGNKKVSSLTCYERSF